MFRKDPESRDFALGLGLTILVVAGFLAYVHWWAPPSARASQSRTEVATKRRIDASVRAGASSKADPKTSSPAVIATVYECNGPNGRVLSDQPCAGNAELRQVLAPNVMPSEGVANDRRAPVRYAPRVAKATRPAALSPTGRNDTQCDWIEKRIDAINARMRQAYSSQEGERFRERLRTLENQRWDAKCRLNQ